MSAAEAKTTTSDKRTAILETVLELAAERGLNDTPISQIAKATGISQGLIYHYFASKDELVFELYREVKLRLLRASLEGFGTQGSYRSNYLTLWKNTLRYYIEHPNETRFLDQFETFPHSEQDWTQVFADLIEPVVTFYRQGVAEGVLKNLPFQILAQFTGGIGLLLAKQHLNGEIEMTDELIEATGRASWDGVAQ